MDMTSGRPQSPRAPRGWPTEDCSRIPNWIYSDPAHYQAELDRIFYGPFWSFIGLECEIPNPGDWKLGVVGERSVIMTRDRDGQVHVLLNSCSHRGAMVCHKKFGHDKELMCPYHQWTFELNGNLIGVPFRRGLKGKGGFPADFDPKNHPAAQAEGRERQRRGLRIVRRQGAADEGLPRRGVPRTDAAHLRRT